MKIPPGKIVALVGVVFFYGVGILAFNLSDDLAVSRMELKRFYETAMDNCTILRIDTLDADNHGGYRVFYTNCSTDFYPVFLEDYDKRALITVNAVISKKANALDIDVRDKENQYKLKIRHPDTQDDRRFITMFGLVLISVVALVILILPNSMFQKR
jgi:hypothetical protein